MLLSQTFYNGFKHCIYVHSWCPDNHGHNLTHVSIYISEVNLIKII